MWDAIVVGAGPAGAITALVLADAGHEVCLVEKEEMPRYKPCGGGLPLHAISLLDDLDVDYEDQVENVVKRVRFLYQSEDPVTSDLTDAPVTMVNRADFDTALADDAAARGANLRTGVGVRDVETGEPCRVILETDEVLEGRFVVGADGANSRVGRAVGLVQEQECGVALDAEVEVDDSTYENERDIATFNINFVEEGYGWTFPKQRYLSLGVGGYGSEHSYPRLIEDYVNQFVGEESCLGKEVYGHPLPYYSGGQPVTDGPVALVGDAAGMVDALSGRVFSTP